MAVDWRERLEKGSSDERRLIAQDFRFSPAELASLRAYTIAHEAVAMMPVPLAVERIVHLAHGSDTVRLELDLCLEGPAAARALLARHLGAFQRPVPEDAIVDLHALGIGDAGAAWRWAPEERNGVAGFVRHNVVVFLQGRHQGLVEQARELDGVLSSLATSESYPDRTAVLFTPPADEAGELRVQAADRADLGAPAVPQGDYFFLAEGGSVNRDPRAPERYYFRAGLAPGRHRIDVFHVGAGILPARQTLAVRIG